METLSVRQVRRLALARAGLLGRRWTSLPRRARGKGARARQAALALIDNFGYLQLDTVAIAGARSHALVLMSRLEGLNPELGEELLSPGKPIFEYWGHEACWMPMDLYPVFEFRRRECRQHPWWGNLIGEHPATAKGLLRRLDREGPLRSQDLEGQGGRGWWDLKIAKKIMTALWSRGDVAIRERRNFQRSYDLRDRVIPEPCRLARVDRSEALKTLLSRALNGHGWAVTGTLAATWRLRNRGPEIAKCLEELREEGKILPYALRIPGEKAKQGWIRPSDLELLTRLERLRPRADRGVLLSPFDPLLWDRKRVQILFGFEQILEIFKPASQRRYGYFCLPVLAGEKLVSRVDLKADKKKGTLQALSCHLEAASGPTKHLYLEATRFAQARHAQSLGLRLKPIEKIG